MESDKSSFIALSIVSLVAIVGLVFLSVSSYKPVSVSNVVSLPAEETYNGLSEDVVGDASKSSKTSRSSKSTTSKLSNSFNFDIPYSFLSDSFVSTEVSKEKAKEFAIMKLIPDSENKLSELISSMVTYTATAACNQLGMVFVDPGEVTYTLPVDRFENVFLTFSAFKGVSDFSATGSVHTVQTPGSGFYQVTARVLVMGTFNVNCRGK